VMESRPFLSRIGYNYYLGSYGNTLLTLGPHYPGVLVCFFVMQMGIYLDFVMLGTREDWSWTAIYIFQVLAILLYILMSVAFLFTALVDPGICFDCSSADDLENGGTSKPRYCDKCDMNVPSGQRIRHCDDCGVCIVGHDHHCPWMGKCVGKGNMRYVLYEILDMLF
jgi:hypothetical protein